MKKIIYIISALVVLVSCAGLDETKYTPMIAAGTFYNTESEANAAIAGMQNYLRDVWCSNLYSTAEGLSEYGYNRGANGNLNYYEIRASTTHRTRCDDMYKGAYRVINFANVAIKGFKTASKLTDAQKAAYTGEARFYRGLSYFFLARFYGGVPLKTDANLDDFNVPRATLEKTYEQIEQDFLAAAADCPDSQRQRSSPNKMAAKTALGELYMYMERYTDAKNILKDVIDNGGYALDQIGKTSDLEKIFGPNGDNSKEEIFFIHAFGTAGCWTTVFLGNPACLIDGRSMMNGYTGYWVSYPMLNNPFIAAWDDNDFRKKFSITACAHGASDSPSFGSDAQSAIFTKFHDPDMANQTSDNPYPIYRLADVYILYSEATARVNGNVPTAESIEYLNRLRRRAYGKNPNTASSTTDYKLADYNTWEKYRDLLITEEMYEHMSEGKHWPLIVRLGVYKQRVMQKVNSNSNFSTSDAKLNCIKYWPIPDAEFIYNTAMDQANDQNPGYASAE